MKRPSAKEKDSTQSHTVSKPTTEKKPFYAAKKPSKTKLVDDSLIPTPKPPSLISASGFEKRVETRTGPNEEERVLKISKTPHTEIIPPSKSKSREPSSRKSALSQTKRMSRPEIAIPSLQKDGKNWEKLFGDKIKDPKPQNSSGFLSKEQQAIPRDKSKPRISYSGYSPQQRPNKSLPRPQAYPATSPVSYNSPLELIFRPKSIAKDPKSKIPSQSNLSAYDFSKSNVSPKASKTSLNNRHTKVGSSISKIDSNYKSNSKLARPISRTKNVFHPESGLSVEKDEQIREPVFSSVRKDSGTANIRESHAGSVFQSKSSQSISRKSLSPQQLTRKLRERSEMAQNSFKLNLQDLLKIDEIFNLILTKKTQEQVLDNYELLKHYITNNYCFVLKDLNLLFYNEKFRDVMRANYLKEFLYFIYIYNILVKNGIEFLLLQKNVLDSEDSIFPDTSANTGKINSHAIKSYIFSVNKETEDLILQILSYIHIVFILRTEIFMDRAAVYYQNHKTFKELSMLLSKRKSKYNINFLKKDNYEDHVDKINRYLDLSEQALRELFKLNPSFTDISKQLLSTVNELSKRSGEITVKEFYKLLRPIKIAFDSKGMIEFEPHIALGMERLLPSPNKTNTLASQFETPRSPFVKSSRASGKMLTLIIDLDETLIHYPDEYLEDLDRKLELNNFKVRPYCAEFLEQLSHYYEIIIFTAASQNYADLIIDHIDRKSIVSHKLYRQHLTVYNSKLIKDLSKIGRDLKNVIILDNVPENFMLQPENGVYVKSWRGDENDKCLLWLLPVFINIAKIQPDDVRDILLELKNLLVANIN